MRMAPRAGAGRGDGLAQRGGADGGASTSAVVPLGENAASSPGRAGFIPSPGVGLAEPFAVDEVRAVTRSRSAGVAVVVTSVTVEVMGSF